MKFLRGYVGVPKGHKFYGKNYEEVPAELHNVHGGLTFANFKDELGYGEDWWFFGFDCAHLGDLVIYSIKKFTLESLERGDVYRDMEYVEKEVKKLADLIDEYSKPKIVRWFRRVLRFGGAKDVR